MTRPDNDTYFMNIAKAVSERATCKRHKVGCVIVDNTNRQISQGYNGAPSGLDHCLDIGCIRDKENIPSGEKQEYCWGAHAEQNALIQAEDRDKLNGATLYCTHTPCLMCLKMLLNAKIKRVVHGGQYPVTDLAWKLIEQSKIKFEEFGKKKEWFWYESKYGPAVYDSIEKLKKKEPCQILPVGLEVLIMTITGQYTKAIVKTDPNSIEKYWAENENMVYNLEFDEENGHWTSSIGFNKAGIQLVENKKGL
jgi:dCMP deaminase